MTGIEPTPTTEAEAEENAGLSHVFDDILTIPNLITLLRLLCLPLFLWLLFAQDDRQNAAWLLGGLGATDWVDGYIARRYDMVSEFGKVFDPLVDRLLFIVAVTAILIDGSMPIWFGVTLLAREILVGLMMAVATIVYKIPRIPVTFLGKAATFALMWAVPGFLLGNSDFVFADFILVASYLVGVPGLVLSVYTGIAYIPKVRAGLAASRDGSAATIPASN
ncbi:MAG: CDP-alcohol phosphatidyltransferase family protein [Ilumatobacteraceae bacterium]